jgi:hypothetical protein
MSASKSKKTAVKPANKTKRPAPSPGKTKPAGRQQSNARSSSRAKKPAPPPSPRPSRPSVWSSLSLDRKLDILGIGMALVGLLTLLSLISRNQGWPGGWLALLGQGFGWECTCCSGINHCGVWLITRHFDRLPRLKSRA